MKNIFTFIVPLLFAGCVSATAETDVSVNNYFIVPVPELPVNLINLPKDVVLPSVSYTHTVDVSSELNKLNDPDNGLSYSVSINFDHLDCYEGFAGVNSLDLVMTSKVDNEVLTLVPHFSLTDQEKAATLISVKTTNDSTSLVKMLERGAIDLTITVSPNKEGVISNGFPIHFHNEISLHATVSVDKSL